MSLGRVRGPGSLPGPGYGGPLSMPPSMGPSLPPDGPYRGPYRGPGPVGRPPRPPRGRQPLLAPLVALLGLVLIAGGSLWGISVLGAGFGDGGTTGATASPSPDPDAPFDPSTEPDGTPDQTPTPDLGPVATPPPDERASVKGTILFTRGGNIWAVSGQELRQLSKKGSDSTPDWAPDGSAIYFVETRVRTVDAIGGGSRGKYTLYYPNIMRMKPNGSKRKEILGSLSRRGKEFWFSWVLQPDVNPNGKTFALVSDGPDGQGEVTLHTLPVKGGRLTDLRVRTRSGLGHNDPAWSPDGKHIAFTFNARDGQDGAPLIAIYTPRTKKVRYLKKGYANPSWSPDGRWLAAERTTGVGRDVVILDAQRGDEVRLTNDRSSFSPVVSPDGDQIAYLHRQGLDIDLRLMTLSFDNGRISLVEDREITEDGSLDAESPPAWFIPRAERKPPPSASIAEPSPSAA